MVNCLLSVVVVVGLFVGISGSGVSSHMQRYFLENFLLLQVGGRMFCRLEKLDGRFEKLQLSQLSRTVALESALQADERIVTVSMSKVC